MNLEKLRHRMPERDIRWFDTIDSTMIEAGRLAGQGCASGTVVGAEEQLAGQGRYGRTWHSEKECGLYLSVVLRLAVARDALPVVTLALGLATADAIVESTGISCDLRWPNDVLIDGKKCAGILTQLHDEAVIAGIGINVNQSEFPRELQGTATSLRLVTRMSQSREALLGSLLESIDTYTKMLETEGRKAILEAFTHASSYVRGRRVVVDQGGATIQGVTEGLDPSGFLIVRKDDGRATLILAGGVRPV